MWYKRSTSRSMRADTSDTRTSGFVRASCASTAGQMFAAIASCVPTRNVRGPLSPCTMRSALRSTAPTTFRPRSASTCPAAVSDTPCARRTVSGTSSRRSSDLSACDAAGCDRCIRRAAVDTEPSSATAYWVAAAGMVGAAGASAAGHLLFWRAAYVLAAVFAAALLVLRARLSESSLFAGQSGAARRGDWTLVVLHRGRLQRYLACIAVGLPVWFVAGILMIFAPELGGALGLPGLVAGRASLAHCVGAFASNLLGGWLGHRMQSRKRAIAVFLAAMGAYLALFLGGAAPDAALFDELFHVNVRAVHECIAHAARRRQANERCGCRRTSRSRSW